MADFLKSIYWSVLRVLPDKPAVYLIYFRGYHKLLNLRNPRYLGEKIQWLKLYGHLEELAAYVDKYEVRKYVEQTIGTQYLNTLYGLYDTPEEIDYSVLPDQFVLKCTNGSGEILIVKDKSQFDVLKANRIMHGWLKDNFYRIKKEPQYKPVKNRIIAEAYLEDESGCLRDYKFFCFDGEPLYYSIYSDRFTNKTADVFDMTGKKLDGVSSGNIKNSNYTLPQPENFQELVEVVRKLAKPFQFVRVDFYIVNGCLYFGELTFTHGGGSDSYTPLEFDLEMAKRIKLGRLLKG